MLWTVDRLLDKELSEHATSWNREVQEVAEDYYLRSCYEETNKSIGMTFKQARKQNTSGYNESIEVAKACLQVVVNSRNTRNLPCPDKIR